jgi:hypothetical protein
MAAVNMDAIQFYNPISTTSSSTRCTASPHMSPLPAVALCRNKGSRVLESHWQSDSTDSALEEDYFPPLEEILRPASRKEYLIGEPTNPEYAIQGTDQRSLKKSSSSKNRAQPSLADSLGTSQGRRNKSALP